MYDCEWFVSQNVVNGGFGSMNGINKEGNPNGLPCEVIHMGILFRYRLGRLATVQLFARCFGREIAPIVSRRFAVLLTW